MSLRNEETDLAEEQFARQFPNISADEMRCKCGECLLPIYEPEFKSFCFELQHIRSVLQFPFHFTSFYRCSPYNRQIYVDRAIAVGSPEPGPNEYLDGPHTIGAADLRISFERMYRLVAEVTSRGMGLGIKQHGNPGLRFAHVDNLGSRLWTY